MSTSLTTADRGTYLKIVLVAGAFNLVAMVLAASMTDRQASSVNRMDSTRIATRGATERASGPSVSSLAPVLVAMSVPENQK